MTMQQTSNKAKEARGTKNKTRSKAINNRTAGAVFEAQAPSPPPGANLSAEQKKIYKQIGERIAASMPMMQIDSYALALLSIWVSIANEAKASIDAKGLIQTFSKTGARALSPEVLLFEKASLNIAKIGANFGLSPKDRIMLLGTLAPKRDEKDPLEGL